MRYRFSTIRGRFISAIDLVEEHQQEVVMVQVTVDTDGMVVAAMLRPAVVAQFGSALAGDVQEDFVSVEKVVHRVDGLGWQVFG